jgi:ElaB/YqjD/DUF883 family membrane-anchored ribosome-binding protein
MNWSVETALVPTTSHRLEEAGHELKRKAEDALATGEGYVRERPVTTVLTALFLGAAVGVLLRQISRSQEPAYSERLGAARHWMEDAYGNVRERLHDAPEQGKQRYHAAKDWLGHAYEDVRDRVKDIEVPHMKSQRKFHFSLPRFHREPTFMEKAEAALGRLRFW